MADINLLPTDFGPDESVSKLSSKIKRFAIAEFVVLTVLVLIAVGSFFLIDSRSKKSSHQKLKLESSIAALEETEQKFVLLKDRLGKVNQVLGTKTAASEIERFDDFNSNLPSSIRFQGANISPTQIEVNYLLTDSKQLVDLFLIIRSSGDFSRVELLSLNYSPSVGYSVGLSLQ